jgi:hypothetical protein
VKEKGRTLDPEIDEGFRRWYEACPCCLSDAHPDVKQVLDDERGKEARAESALSGSAHHGPTALP